VIPENKNEQHCLLNCQFTYSKCKLFFYIYNLSITKKTRTKQHLAQSLCCPGQKQDTSYTRHHISIFLLLEARTSV